MSINIIKGNIWNTNCQVLVNTVNCEGFMGAGIALEAKLRYPDMFQNYKDVCDKKLLKIGKLLLYKKSTPYWILNFPTKKQWKLPSKEEYIVLGLKKFIDTYEEKGISSIAFPILGASHGGLDEANVLSIMKEMLSPLPIQIEIYLYDPKSTDDFFINLKEILLSTDISLLSKQTKIKKQYLELLIHEMQTNSNYCQVNQLLNIKGIGEVTLEKIFHYKTHYHQVTNSLF